MHEQDVHKSGANERKRRVIAGLAALLISASLVACQETKTNNKPAENPAHTITNQQAQVQGVSTVKANEALKKLAIKGRAPKTGYAREQFGAGWSEVDSCDTRQFILKRDLTAVKLADDNCKVLSGTLNDPYTGKTIEFHRGIGTSTAVQIDHVVALSDAWQKGAQQLDVAERTQMANDPLELLAVDGPANEQKGDGDAATWLPSNKAYRCRYVARQIAVKEKYHLWVTVAEHDAMENVLSTCPDQMLPIE